MGIAADMTTMAKELLETLDDDQRRLALHQFDDVAARHWLEYRPLPRPGACVGELSVPARKAANRLLASGLSKVAYAQAMAIVGLEETLDRLEGWEVGRRSGNYWVNVFGDVGDGPWGWRFEGHHLSVSMTVDGDEVSPAPVFFGANPHRVAYAGRTISRPLAPEEDLGRALLEAMGPREREQAVVADQAPEDIRTATGPRAAENIEPYGISAGRLGPTARAALAQLVALYLDRLPPELAAREQAKLTGDVHFAWEGPSNPGTRHYYRVQSDDLLIEYDNTTPDGNHAHTVLRRPRSDFGADILAAHLATESGVAAGSVLN